MPFAEAGTYCVWARTKDWVAHWEAPGAPGRFQIAIGGKTLETEFGTEGAEWHWKDGGEIELTAGEPHANRSSRSKVHLEIDGSIAAKAVVNHTEPALLKNGFHSLGRRDLKKDQQGAVIFLTEGADNSVIADAVQLLKKE